MNAGAALQGRNTHARTHKRFPERYPEQHCLFRHHGFVYRGDFYVVAVSMQDVQADGRVLARRLIGAAPGVEAPLLREAEGLGVFRHGGAQALILSPQDGLVEIEEHLKANSD